MDIGHREVGAKRPLNGVRNTDNYFFLRGDFPPFISKSFQIWDHFFTFFENPAHGRHWISWPIWIVGPIQLCRGCMIFLQKIYIYKYIFFWGEVAWFFFVNWLGDFFNNKKKIFFNYYFFLEIAQYFVWKGCVIVFKTIYIYFLLFFFKFFWGEMA